MSKKKIENKDAEYLISFKKLNELAERFWQTRSHSDRQFLIMTAVTALSQWNRLDIGSDIDRENYADELGIEIDRSLPDYAGSEESLAQWSPKRGSFSKWLWARNKSRLVNYYLEASKAVKAVEIAQEADQLTLLYGGKVASVSGTGRDGRGYKGPGRGPRSFTWNKASESAFAVRGPSWPTDAIWQKWKAGVRKGMPKMLRCTAPICFGRSKEHRGGHLFIAGTNLRDTYQTLCPDCWSGKHEMETELNKVLSGKADIVTIPAPAPAIKPKKTRTNKFTSLRVHRTAS